MTTGIPARIVEDLGVIAAAAEVLAALASIPDARLDSIATLSRRQLLEAAEKVMPVMPAHGGFGLVPDRPGVAWEATYGQIGLFLPDYILPADEKPGRWADTAKVVVTGVVEDTEAQALLDAILPHLRG